MTDANYTHITVLVDRSGSMGAIESDAEGGLRAFVEEQRKQPGKLTFSVSQFDTQYDEVVRMAAGDPLENWHLVPRHLTALLDATGKAITSTGEDLSALPEHERPGKVVFVIVTDGLENASKEWTRSQILALVRKQTDIYGWDFVYTAAGQDAISVASDLGVDNAMNFAPTGDGVQRNYSTLSASVSSYRSSSTSKLQVPTNA